MKPRASKIDYSKAMLPRTRREQFGDCFKMNYRVLLKCGLMLFVFFIPLLAGCLFMDLYYLSLMNIVTPEEVNRTVLLFNYILYSGIVVLSLPVFTAFSGITHVLRNLIWGEGIYFSSDFGSGIKANAPKNVLFGFISGVLFFASFFVSTIVKLAFVGYFPLILFVVILFPIYFWMMFLNNTYSSKWTSLVRNGFYFYIKNIGWSLLGMLMPLSLVGLLFIPGSLIWLKYVILVLFIVFIFPIILLIMTLYSTSKFDQYINRDNYPDYYLRGLNHD